MINKNSLCTKKERRHIIDTFNIFILLRDKSISGFMLEKETGVSRTTLLKVRANKEQFQNLSIKTLSKIQEWLLSKNGQSYLASSSNAYNLKALEDIQSGDVDLYKQIDLDKVEAFIKNSFIKTGLFEKAAGFSSMERSLFKRGKKDIYSMTLKKVVSIQKLINQIEQDGLATVMEFYG